MAYVGVARDIVPLSSQDAAGAVPDDAGPQPSVIAVNMPCAVDLQPLPVVALQRRTLFEYAYLSVAHAGEAARAPASDDLPAE
jgi:hypothetical protein